MRKRLLIGAIAVAVVCGAAYVILPPSNGTVEDHKVAYTKLLHEQATGTWTETIAPQGIRRAIDRWRERRLAHHRQALVRLGYLAEVTLAASNAPTEVVMGRVVRSTLIGPPLIEEEINWRYFSDSVERSNSTKVTCLLNEVELWRRAFGKADVDDATWIQRMEATGLMKKP